MWSIEQHLNIVLSIVGGMDSTYLFTIFLDLAGQLTDAVVRAGRER